MMRCFQGLAGLLAGTGLIGVSATMMVGCGPDFSGCEASRTCPSKGGGSGLAGFGGMAGQGDSGGGTPAARGGGAGSSNASGEGGDAPGSSRGKGGDSPEAGGNSSGSGGAGGSGGTRLSGLAGEGGEQSGGAGDGDCPNGFTGPDCAKNIDDCASDPCGTKPNSHCVDGVATHTCVCDLGFTGAECLPRLELLTPGFGLSVGEAVNADGTVVVGDLQDTPQSSSHPFRWTRTTGAVTLMSNSETVDWGFAQSVSTDGSVVAGHAKLPSGEYTYRWTEETGITTLALGDTGYVSGNGSTIVGRDTSPSDGFHLFRWTSATGAADLGVFKDGYIGRLSRDGTTIVGGYDKGAFLWTSGDGTRLLTPSGDSGSANAVTGDGRFIVGGYSSGGDRQPFTWKRPQNFADLDVGDLVSSEAVAVSNDGSVIIGTGFITKSDQSLEGSSWVWSNAEGVRMLPDILTTQGVDVSGYYDFKVTDVADDGTTIIGSVASDLVIQAFIARLGD